MFSKDEFPALSQKINGHPLTYLDSAATTLKPKSVADRIQQFYLYEASNVHRGAHYLSSQATEHYELVRTSIQKFINAKDSSEVIFTRGTTESINLVATSYVKNFLKEGDEILLTDLEHHSNIVPWQMVAEEKKFKIKFIPINPDGTLNLNEYRKLITDRTQFLALSHCSNVLGTVNPIEEMIKIARGYNIKVLVDAAQTVGFKTVDVKKIDCDFLVFSAHKMFGPFGVGVLWGKKELLSEMPPYQGGGSMISEVTAEKTSFLPPPHRFEAGTPAIAEIIGFGEAIQFINSKTISAIAEHKKHITTLARAKLQEFKGIQILGPMQNDSGIISFLMDKIHAADAGSILDKMGIAVRTGHHCAQPLMKKLNITGTIRMSASVYNDENDISKLILGLKKVQELCL